MWYFLRTSSPPTIHFRSSFSFLHSKDQASICAHLKCTHTSLQSIYVLMWIWRTTAIHGFKPRLLRSTRIYIKINLCKDHKNNEEITCKGEREEKKLHGLCNVTMRKIEHTNSLDFKIHLKNCCKYDLLHAMFCQISFFAIFKYLAYSCLLSIHQQQRLQKIFQ